MNFIRKIGIKLIATLFEIECIWSFERSYERNSQKYNYN